MISFKFSIWILQQIPSTSTERHADADRQKHLGLILDSKLNFNEHIENKITKCNKVIGLMKNF